MRRAAIAAALHLHDGKEITGDKSCPLVDKAFEAAQRRSSSSTAGKRSLSSPVRLSGRANAAMRKRSHFGKPSAKTSTENSRVTDGRLLTGRFWRPNKQSGRSATRQSAPPQGVQIDTSDFDAFRQRQRIFQMNSEVPHRVFNAAATPWRPPLSIMPSV